MSVRTVEQVATFMRLAKKWVGQSQLTVSLGTALERTKPALLGDIGYKETPHRSQELSAWRVVLGKSIWPLEKVVM